MSKYILSRQWSWLVYYESCQEYNALWLNVFVSKKTDGGHNNAGVERDSGDFNMLSTLRKPMILCCYETVFDIGVWNLTP